MCFYHANFSNLQKDIQFQKICTKKYILVEKSVRNVQRNYVYFIAKLKDHYTKKKHKCPHINPLKRLKAVDYPINQGNPKNLFKTNSESYLEIFINK